MKTPDATLSARIIQTVTVVSEKWRLTPSPCSGRMEKERLYAELAEKHGEQGTDKDWFLTMDGSVHVNPKEADNE